MTNQQCTAETKAWTNVIRCPRKITTTGAEYCDEHLSILNKFMAKRCLGEAAPELLEALEESTDGLRDFLAVQTFREGNFEQCISTINFLISANEALIAKAKGKKK